MVLSASLRCLIVITSWVLSVSTDSKPLVRFVPYMKYETLHTIYYSARRICLHGASDDNWSKGLKANSRDAFGYPSRPCSHLILDLSDASCHLSHGSLSIHPSSQPASQHQEIRQHQRRTEHPAPACMRFSSNSFVARPEDRLKIALLDPIQRQT